MIDEIGTIGTGFPAGPEGDEVAAILEGYAIDLATTMRSHSDLIADLVVEIGSAARIEDLLEANEDEAGDELAVLVAGCVADDEQAAARNNAAAWIVENVTTQDLATRIAAVILEQGERQGAAALRIEIGVPPIVACADGATFDALVRLPRLGAR